MAEGQWIPFPDNPWDEVTHNLWMGGMYYGPSMSPCAPNRGDFDVVISMAGRGNLSTRPHHSIEQYAFLIDDGQLGKDELALVYEARDLAVAAVMAGRKTLVRCQAGLNRSGLVVALTLLLLPPFRGACCSLHAIALVQGKRSQHALHNPHFVDYIKQAGAVSLTLPEGVDISEFSADQGRHNNP